MHLKKLSCIIIALSTSSLCTVAYADGDTGFYIGGQLGYGNADYGSVAKELSPMKLSLGDDFIPPQITIPLPYQTTEEGGIAGRIYAGYQFNPYFGVETGYSLFSDNTYKANFHDNSGNNFSKKATLETSQWDILAKAGSPFGNSGFRGDIKAGMAYIMSKLTLTQTAIIPAIPRNKTQTTSATQNEWAPVAGASITYNLNKNLAMDISYLHTFGSGNLNTPNTDLVTLGVSYLFA